MLRRVIQGTPFPGLLGMAATYSLAATLAMLFIADVLTRAPVIWALNCARWRRPGPAPAECMQ